MASSDKGYIGGEFDAFHQHWGTVAVRDGQHGIKNSIAPFFIHRHPYQTAVDLDQLEAEFIESGQVVIAGAKVIDRQFESVLVGQLQHFAGCAAGVVDQFALRDFQGQLAGMNTMAVQGLISPLQKEGGFEMGGTDIDRQITGRVGF